MTRFLTRVAVVFAALSIAMVVAIIGLVFLCIGLYHTFREIAGGPAAAFWTGLCALAAALIIAGIARLVLAMRGGSAPATANPSPSLPGQSELASWLGQRLGEAVAARKWPSLYGAAAALVLGFSLGVSPALRRGLLDLLKRAIRGK
ncbi:MAG TPA: hypothetical protein VKY65_13285 [Alphaproteobacteria bacterium]|nr:hypothetical protein [Alphaproteobacteria bacterium]